MISSRRVSAISSLIFIVFTTLQQNDCIQNCTQNYFVCQCFKMRQKYLKQYCISFKKFPYFANYRFLFCPFFFRVFTKRRPQRSAGVDKIVFLALFHRHSHSTEAVITISTRMAGLPNWLTTKYRVGAVSRWTQASQTSLNSATSACSRT